MSTNARPCDRLKTHIYTEADRIQALTEQYIQANTDYVKQRIPQSQFVTEIGETPVRVRYRSAVPERAKYLNMLVEGNVSETDYATSCNGSVYGFSGTPNRRGSVACNTPATKITAGYDTFGRSLKIRAWETDPICAMDLILKGHAGPYIEMLRRDMPKRGMEEFSTALEDEVIAYSKFNFSMIQQWTWAAGVFPAEPTGTLNIGYLKRIRAHMMLQGWTGPFEIQVGREALERAIRDWQSSNSYTIQINSLTQDATGLAGLEALSFEGINFIITDRPKRGYLRPVVGGHEFVEVLPVRNRAGTGDGIVAEPNPDYLNCVTYCDGQKYELFEVGFSIHPTFGNRLALAPVQLAGLQVASMNMEVRMIDGPYIECNDDNTKFKLRMVHNYGFEAPNPELACAVLYRVSPPKIEIVAPDCPDACTEGALETVSVAELQPPPADDCYDAELGDCEEEVVHRAADGTPTDPLPDPTDNGEIRFVGLEANVEAVANAVFYLTVERVGGWDGAASVDIDTANGTATSGSGDFVVLNSSVSYGDGENGRKRVAVTLGATPTPNQSFSVVLSNPSGATLDGDADTVTVNLLEACSEE